MVSDDHEIADKKRSIHSASSIGNEKLFYAYFVQNPDRKGYFLHRISFKKMKTSLHSNDIFPTELSDQKIPFVALYCR